MPLLEPRNFNAFRRLDNHIRKVAPIDLMGESGLASLRLRRQTRLLLLGSKRDLIPPGIHQEQHKADSFPYFGYVNRSEWARRD